MEAQDAQTLAVVERLNRAVNDHDLDALASIFTEDCVFENTYPPPDGQRFEGLLAVLGFWQDFFDSSHGAWFEFEEIFTAGDRCVSRWIYRYETLEGEPHHLRGADILKVREGQVSEKFSYVKG